MGATPKTECQPNAHEWIASLVEAGVDVCAWCNATREAAPDVSEPSASVVVVVVEERRAAA
jgi:hypothetical protein